MKAILKLEIQIDAELFTNKKQSPQEELLKTLDSIEGVKYSFLDPRETNETCIEKIFKSGLTNVLTPEVYLEFLATPNDNTSDIILVFERFLDGIIISDHLILIDRYIFHDANKNHEYSDFVTKIFSKHLKKLQKVTFITSKRNFNKNTQEEIYDSFRNVKSKLQLDTQYTDIFHDRFWICGNQGLFVGSSLNGIGKKYCLVDYVDHDDVLAIRKVLNEKRILKFETNNYDSLLKKVLENMLNENDTKTSFDPISNTDTTILILGTMPGDKSIELGEYYGHSRNRFWKIISTITNNDLPITYSEKKELLLNSKIGVWDVVHKANRKGSLDNDIKDEEPNDLNNFIARHKNIKVIGFNGAKSQALFDKHFDRKSDLTYISLPSTSPANTTINFESICKIWQQLLEK